MEKIGYLGPRGTFTEKAVKGFNLAGDFILYESIKSVLEGVHNGEVFHGVVPVQNTTEGIVNVTIDTLTFDVDLQIKKQLVLPVSHSLMVNKNNKDCMVDKILSHPQAIAQTRKYVGENFKHAEIIEVSSTAKAGEIVAGSNENIAAICTDICADIYDLKVLKNDIQDLKNNKTYFILVSKEKNDVPKNHNKMSIVFSTSHKPGELYKVLDIFSLWDINITQITSRPMRDTEGEYIFYIDIEITDNSDDVKDALVMVKRKSNFFKIFGSYDVKMNI